MSKWISVDVEIPDIKRNVLIRVSCSDYFNIEEGWYIGDGEWCNCWYSTRNRNLYPVTHWMPLPEPPKQD